MFAIRLFSGANGSKGAQWRRKTVRSDGRRASIAKICAECLCNVVQKRKYKGSAGLQLPEVNAPSTPVDVIERKPSNIARAQTVAGTQQKDRVISAAECGRLVHRGQDALDLCCVEHIRKVHMPILSRPWNCIAQRVRRPALDGCPAKEDAEGGTVRAPRPDVARVFIKVSHVPGRDVIELGDAGVLQVLSKRR
jgi:hypothetical protein